MIRTVLLMLCGFVSSAAKGQQEERGGTIPLLRGAGTGGSLDRNRHLNSYSVPFQAPAVVRDGTCPTKSQGSPLDSYSTNDAICGYRGADCTIIKTNPGDNVDYDFTNDDYSSLNFIFRASSANANKRIQVELVGTDLMAILASPGAGFDTFGDLSWKSVSPVRMPLLAGIPSAYTLRVTFLDGHVNLCAVSVSKQHYLVPFDLPAHAFSSANELSNATFGDCGRGTIDGQITNDPICNARGANCNIGWTQPGEWLEYLFDVGPRIAEPLRLDVTIRIASVSSSKTIRLKMENFLPPIENYQPPPITVAAPGKGYQAFEDIKWKGVLHDGNEGHVIVTFPEGGVNICSISIAFSSDIPNPPSGTRNIVPFHTGARDFVSYDEVTPAHYGDCGIGPVDGKATKDAQCVARGGGCAVGFTSQGEVLRYDI